MRRLHRSLRSRTLCRRRPDGRGTMSKRRILFSGNVTLGALVTVPTVYAAPWR